MLKSLGQEGLRPRRSPLPWRRRAAAIAVAMADLSATTLQTTPHVLDQHDTMASKAACRTRRGRSYHSSKSARLAATSSSVRCKPKRVLFSPLRCIEMRRGKWKADAKGLRNHPAVSPGRRSG